MDYNPPGSSVHGNLQARILEWVAIPFSWKLSCKDPHKQNPEDGCIKTLFIEWEIREIFTEKSSALKSQEILFF